MVYIETLIECRNCEYQKKLYSDQCLEIADIILDFQFKCKICNKECCLECTLLDLDNNVYCEKCYWKYIQVGLRNVKND